MGGCNCRERYGTWRARIGPRNCRRLFTGLLPATTAVTDNGAPISPPTAVGGDIAQKSPAAAVGGDFRGRFRGSPILVLPLRQRGWNIWDLGFGAAGARSRRTARRRRAAHFRAVGAIGVRNLLRSKKIAYRMPRVITLDTRPR